ncbi:hypothetical protein FRB96_009210 [Tulasnella sp. 330]|nr:hypothetical protein FRB96_009210 [Tulasnella sp. 330]
MDPRGSAFKVAPTPFDHLPIEVLTHIFIFATRRENEIDLARGLEIKTIFPYTALGVCRLWRELTLNTPAIWRVAVITTHPAWVSRLATHMDICKSNPMRIDVYLDPDNVGDFQSAIADAAEMGRRDSTEIETSSVTVRVIVPGDVQIGMEWMHLLFPSTFALKSLEVRWDPPAASKYPNTIAELCRDTRYLCGLRSLILHGVTLESRQGTVEGFLSGLIVLEELRIEACRGYVGNILRRLDNPTLRSIAIDCTALPGWCSKLHHTYFTDLPLFSVRHLVLYNVPSRRSARSILYCVSKATRIVFRCTESLVIEDLVFDIEKFCPDLTSLVILSPFPGMREIREIVTSWIPKLRTLELQGVPYGSLSMDEVSWLKEKMDLKLVAETEGGYMETWAESGISVGLSAI